MTDIVNKNPVVDLEEYGKLCFQLVSSIDGGAQLWEVVVAAHQQLSLIVQESFTPGADASTRYGTFVFGGCVTFGVWDGSSDIDVSCIPATNFTQTILAQEKNCIVLASFLKKIGLSPANLETILRARVPIVKYHRSIKHKVSKAWVSNHSSLHVVFKENVLAGESWLESINTRGVPFRRSPVWRNNKDLLLYFGTAEDAIRFVFCMEGDDNIKHFTPKYGNPFELQSVDFDVSFRHFGLRNSIMLRRYLLQQPCARPGAIVIKKWAKLHGVSDSRAGYLTSYCMVIMWVYYLIQKGVLDYLDLEDVKEIPREDYNLKTFYVPLVSEENKADETFMRQLHLDLGKHVQGFFTFYTTEFSRENDVVTLNTKSVCSKESLGWLSHDAEDSIYLMAIQDPYEDNLNLGRKINQRKFQRIIDLMKTFLVNYPLFSFEKESITLEKASSIIYNALAEYTNKVGPISGKAASEFLVSDHYNAYAVVQKKYSLITNFVRKVQIKSLGKLEHGTLRIDNGYITIVPRSVRGSKMLNQAKCNDCGRTDYLWKALNSLHDIGAYCDNCWIKYEEQ